MAPHHPPLNPRAELATHRVANQAPPFEDVNVYETDAALIAATRAADPALREALSAFGARAGSGEAAHWSREANAHPPRLVAFDRYGHRLDEVSFHPAYHELMAMGFEAGVAAAPWTRAADGHLQHAALLYMMAGVDGGVCCPMSMTYAATPALRAAPALAAHWEPLATAAHYDQRFIPSSEKYAATIGMAMTEKQGGSDVRANETRARALGDGLYELEGHKWFCSAPMSDAFLTLAKVGDRLSCFLAPRWREDGSRNAIHLMRLKDKMGDRSNASSEIEYHGAQARMIGEEGRGVAAIIEMVAHTRLDCAVGSAGAMRAGLAQAIWHAAHRTAFQKKLIDQPAMTATLADLALETEAAAALSFRLARAFDRRAADAREAAFLRLATPIAKFWICKRQPAVAYETLEALGGAGFIEEAPMARLYRASPLNAIWEGSGNVIALDALRAMAREPAALDAVREELSMARGANAHLDAHLDALEKWFEPGALDERAARAFAEDLGLALEAAALRESAPDFVFDGFCAARLDPDHRSLMLGAVTARMDARAIVARASPLT